MKVVLYYLNLVFLHVPKLSWVLSNHSLVKAFKLTFFLWYFLVSRKTFLRLRPQHFNFQYKNKRFGLTLVSAVDVAALVEVFALEEYFWNLGRNPRNILDLGAHWGDTAIYYAVAYPSANIYSLEPSPSVFERLKQQTAQFSNIFPSQEALGKTNGEINFYVSESSLANSVVERSGRDKKITVPSVSLEELCRRIGVVEFDLVKFDIEGAEKFIFSDELAKNKSAAFIGEIHLDLMEYTIEDIKSYFSDFKTEFEKINDHRYVVKAQRLAV